MIRLRAIIERQLLSIYCPSCNGIADRVPLTRPEIKHQSCGRKYECCGRAFVCRTCKERIVGEAVTPDTI